MHNGLIYDIKRFAIHDGPGIRTTVFFKGCPLNCWWCHNPESRSPGIQECIRERKINGQKLTRKENVGQYVSVEEVLVELEKDRLFYEESGGGVTFSGGEPLQQPEFLAALLQASKETGLHTCLDTCGYAPAEVWKKILPLPDLLLYDLKTMDPGLHEKYTGVPLQPVMDNFQMIKNTGKRTIVRYPVIPGVNDRKENMESLHGFLYGLDISHEIHLLPYHRTAREKYRRFGLENRMEQLPVPEQDTLEQIKHFFEGKGYRVNIGG